MAKVFISYRRSDSHWAAHEIFDRLKPMAHKSKDQIFIDLESIKPGEDFMKSIERGVAGCDVMVVMIGPNWIDTRHQNGGRRLDDPKDIVRAEVASALKLGITVVPVLLDGARFPSEEELPDDLKPMATRNATMVAKRTFDEDIAILGSAIGLDPKRAKGRKLNAAGRSRRQFWHSRPPLFLTWHKTLLLAAIPVLLIVAAFWEIVDLNVDLMETVFLAILWIVGYFLAARAMASVLHFIFYVVRVIVRPRHPA
ncbi:MAG: TIR domain-containing protein [Pseudomonadota bacterium]